MSIGNVRFIRITGWLTDFTIPISSLNAEGNSWRQFADHIPCGPYWILGSMLFWLQVLAKERGINLIDNKEYVFKAWVFAPIVPNIHEPCYQRYDAWMMMLRQTIDNPDIFERIEVFKVFMASDEMGDWMGEDVEDLAVLPQKPYCEQLLTLVRRMSAQFRLEDADQTFRGQVAFASLAYSSHSAVASQLDEHPSPQ